MAEEEPKLNNARLQTFGGYVCIHSFVPVDPAKGIWKGIQLVQPDQRSEIFPYVYFSRNYMPETNDLDKVFPEVEWTDPELIGVPFLLVQKEKLLFGLVPSPKHGIVLPAPQSIRRPRPQM